MATILTFDTETTGFPNKGGRLVQLGALLQDENEKILAEINLLVQPDGFDIPQVCTDIHGISTSDAQQYGVPLIVALSAFNHLAKKATRVVAHNHQFDLAIMQNEFNFVKRELPIEVDLMKFCTMLATTQLCKLPNPRGPGYKWPKLQEAHKFAFNEEFDNAHSAMADVRACSRLYFWLAKEHPHLIK
jgi:DNA polymerase III epsilon subunit-like protein